jgi:hypothetical protein
MPMPIAIKFYQPITEIAACQSLNLPVLQRMDLCHTLCHFHQRSFRYNAHSRLGISAFASRPSDHVPPRHKYYLVIVHHTSAGEYVSYGRLTIDFLLFQCMRPRNHAQGSPAHRCFGSYVQAGNKGVPVRQRPHRGFMSGVAHRARRSL